MTLAMEKKEKSSQPPNPAAAMNVHLTQAATHRSWGLRGVPAVPCLLCSLSVGKGKRFLLGGFLFSYAKYFELVTSSSALASARTPRASSSTS